MTYGSSFPGQTVVAVLLFALVLSGDILTKREKMLTVPFICHFFNSHRSIKIGFTVWLKKQRY